METVLAPPAAEDDEVAEDEDPDCGSGLAATRRANARRQLDRRATMLTAVGREIVAGRSGRSLPLIDGRD